MRQGRVARADAPPMTAVTGTGSADAKPALAGLHDGQACETDPHSECGY
jgi:hypothetical protein